MLEVIKHNGSGAIFRPPSGFRKAQYPKGATFAVNGHHASAGTSEAQKKGKRYERKVLEWLEDQEGFVGSPWIGFRDHTAADRLCQPDALIVGEKTCTIIEIKRMHTILAYWQLRHLYEPVVRNLFPKLTTHVVEITASFDPRTPWPEDIAYLNSLDDIQELGSMYGAMQWRR